VGRQADIQGHAGTCAAFDWKGTNMSNTPSLLPCPFCGGINIIHCGHHMYCHACGADGPDADSQHESEARSAWNRRTPQPVVREPELDQFLSDVMTAAGLVTHGKQCKQLGERLGAAVMKLRVHNIPQKGCD